MAVAGYHARATLYWTQALVSVLGEEKAKAYLERLTGNGLQILGDDEAVRNGVAQGRFAVGLTESADAYAVIAAAAPLGLVYPDQGADGIGTLVRPHIVATVGGPNHSGAQRFVDFLLSASVQRYNYSP